MKKLKLNLYSFLFLLSLSIIRSTDEAIRSFFTKSWYDIQTMSDSEFDTIFNSAENQKKLFACRIEMLEKSIIELKKNQRPQDRANLIEAQNNYNKLIESIDLLLEKQLKRITVLTPELYLLLLPSQAVKHIDVNLRRALLSDREQVSNIFQLLKQMKEKERYKNTIFLSKEDVNFIPSDLLDFDFLFKTLTYESAGFIEETKIRNFFANKENVDKFAALFKKFNLITLSATFFLKNLTALQLDQVIEYLPLEAFPYLNFNNVSQLSSNKLSQVLTEERQKEIYEYSRKRDIYFFKGFNIGFLTKLDKVTPEFFALMDKDSTSLEKSSEISIKEKNIEEKVKSIFKTLSEKQYLEKTEQDFFLKQHIKRNLIFLYKDDYESLKKEAKKYKVNSLFENHLCWSNKDHTTEILLGTLGVVGLGFVITSFLKVRQNKLKPRPNPVELKPNLVQLKPIMKISPSIKSF